MGETGYTFAQRALATAALALGFSGVAQAQDAGQALAINVLEMPFV